MNVRPGTRDLSRREFISGTGAAIVTFGGAVPRVLCQAAARSPQRDRVLVVVEMAGGNDGLNSVIPHSDPIYQEARQQIGIGKADTLAVTSQIGLHPSLRGFADLLEQGKFAVVQGVGYDNPNRSHFESMDIWHSCQRKDGARRNGWVGRYLESGAIGNSLDPAALHLGSEKQPFALTSDNVRVPSIQSLEQFRLRVGEGESTRDLIHELVHSQREDENPLLGFIQSSTQSALAASTRMEAVTAENEFSAKDSASGLGGKLETVAKLIAAGLQTRVYYVRIDGFDTHANQPDAHAALLREVSEAVGKFVGDVNARGDGDRVLVVCFSEFGRRVAENASDGTDHGTAGPVFVAGNKVNAGLIGDHPDLANLENGDLRYHTDFRQVYADVLQNWLSCPSEPILGGAYEPIDLLKG